MKQQESQWFTTEKATKLWTPTQVVQTTGNVYFGEAEANATPDPPPAPDRAPLDWLRGEVEEMCELARAA